MSPTDRGLRSTLGHRWVLLVAAVVLLAGCSPSLSSGDQGFVTGDGTVNVVAEADRKPPAGEVAGETVDGKKVSLEDYRGKVVIMPVWGAWCGPCRKEAPGLALASRDLSDKGIAVFGVNSRDRNKVDVQKFLERFDIPYDSIFDEDGQTLLAFRGTLPPMSIPSFVFIDAAGLVAARILGPADLSTIYGVLEDLTGDKLTVPRATT